MSEKHYGSKEITSKFITIAPPLLDFENDILWFYNGDSCSPRVIYDDSNFAKTNTKELFEVAFVQPLSVQDQQTLFDSIVNDRNIIENSALTPENLPQLLENNPVISTELLLRLAEANALEQYLPVLVNASVTLHSMEVVNRLTLSVTLPPDFIQLYTSNCIMACEMLKDKYMQSRMVRLVCVFIQSLLRNKIIHVKELLMQIESFCIGFSKIKEAAGLYRLVKQIDTGESAN